MPSSTADVGTPRCRSCGTELEPYPTEPSPVPIPLGYCKDCIDEHGHPKSYEDVFDRLVKELVKKEKMDVASAERAVEERMSGLPAWTEE